MIWVNKNGTEISSEEFDSNLADLIREFPNCSEVMLRELLKRSKIEAVAQRWSVKKVFWEIL